MAGLFTAKPSRRERDAARERLAKDRAEKIVGNLCAVTRLALEEGRILTPLAYEATFRTTIRSELCLQGWSWQAADDTAQDVVAVVFSILQVKRPDWYEGQPEWTIKRGTLVERTRCANCGYALPEGHAKFCSTPCRNVHGLRLKALREADEQQMATLASRSPL